MTLPQIARFELRYQLRQPRTWFIFAIFFLVTLATTTSSSFTVGSGANVLKNAPYSIAEVHLVWSLFFMFVSTALVAGVLVRDDQTGFGALVRSTPVGKGDYLFGRFFGAFAVVALTFLSIPLAIWLASVAPWVDPALMGPNRFGDYAYAYVVLALPVLFVTSALFFALATMTRSMMSAYLGIVALLVGYIAFNKLVQGQEHASLVALLDPFGLSAFKEATKYWTQAERNTQMPALQGMLLANRLLWIAIGGALLAGTWRLYRFEERPRTERKSKAEAAEQAPEARPLATPRFGAGTSFVQLAARTRFEVRQVVRSPAFVILLVLGVLNALQALAQANELYNVQLHPVTRLMVGTLRGAFSLFPVIVAAYYAGELVWREREHRIHLLVDATPAPDWAFFAPKTIALGIVLVGMLSVGCATALLVQLAKGHTHVELGKYLFWYLLPGAVDWTLLAVLAVFLQTLAPSKPAGWGLMLLYLVSTMLLEHFGFAHGLYRYGEGPTVPLSDMNGLGKFIIGANWFRAYWSAWALLLAVAGQLVWPRGAEAPLRERLLRPRRIAAPMRAIAATALLLVAGTGGYIFVNTNVWNEYRTQEEHDALLADMERELLRYETAAEPTITDVKLQFDLHPHEPRLVTSGTYVLENRTGAPLEEMHVSFHERLRFEQLEIEGAQRATSDERFPFRIFRFTQPLQPGEKRTLTFRSVLAQRGFKLSGNTTRIVDNGTFVTNVEFAPQFGVSRSGFLKDRATRRKYGLSEVLHQAPLEDEHARRRNYLNADWVHLDLTVTTDADQTPLAPGSLVSDETRDGRRTARFVSDGQVLNFFSILSAKYEVARETHKGVELSVFHDAQHPYNVERMITAMKVSLDAYQEMFGPYPHRLARIVEFPAYAMYAQTFPTTMPYAEGLGFIADFSSPEDIDYVTYVTAHEMAHQWWAEQLVGADAQGSAVLSETLAQYSALLVMERLYGQHQVRKFLKFELDDYLRARSTERVEELPLVRVESQPYIYYNKGSLVMYLLRDRIGVERVNHALRTMLERYRFQGAPYPTSQVLVDALRAEAGPEQQQLVTDLFEKIALYDLRTTSAKVTPRSDGRFDVALQVSARKLYADGKGAETESALGEGETFDVGLFLQKPGKKGFGADSVLHFARVPLKSGEQTITLTVDKRPAFAGVDPYNKQIDRDSDDNLVALSE